MASTLDPANWEEFRALAHRMVDDMVDYQRDLPDRPVWQDLPAGVVDVVGSEPVPYQAQGEQAAYEQFVRDVLPYPNGNLHPRFFGWVQGCGMPLASMADMLASAMNPHMAGFHQAPALVEKQVVRWMAELMGFPSSSSGVLESGGTMANTLALAVARHAAAGFDVHGEGLRSNQELTVYCSAETHGWVVKAVELLGLGRESLRNVAVSADFRIDLEELRQLVAEDVAAGKRPICVIGTAGTVVSGATDDLNGLADFCAERGIWFHVDAAFGAFLKLSAQHRHLVDGLERADSVAMDLHKWMSLPFEIACLLIRDETAHTATFAKTPSYLAQFDRGVMAGGLPFADRGMDLSRGFKALKAWVCLKAYGVESFAAAI
jgi:glutamate/tyrosine decarboxylase-like PLP-dependent enzyme